VTLALIPAFSRAAAVTPAQWLPAYRPLGRAAREAANAARLLVSDLGVNQSDISSLIGAVRKDLPQAGLPRGFLA